MAWSHWFPFTLPNVRRYAPFLAGVYEVYLDDETVYLNWAPELDAQLRRHLEEGLGPQCLQEAIQGGAYVRWEPRRDAEEACRMLLAAVERERGIVPRCNRTPT